MKGPRSSSTLIGASVAVWLCGCDAMAVAAITKQSIISATCSHHCARSKIYHRGCPITNPSSARLAPTIVPDHNSIAVAARSVDATTVLLAPTIVPDHCESVQKAICRKVPSALSTHSGQSIIVRANAQRLQAGARTPALQPLPMHHDDQPDDEDQQVKEDTPRLNVFSVCSVKRLEASVAGRSLNPSRRFLSDLAPRPQLADPRPRSP